MASFSHGNLTTLVWFHLGAYRGVLLQWISCLYNGLTFDTYIAMCSVEQGIFNAFENVVRPCWRLVPYIFNDNAHTHIETWSFGKIGEALSLSLCFFFKYLMIAEKMFLATTISRNAHTSNINKKYWEVVVAQLVERSLSMPEVCGLTPVIGKISLSICLLSTVLKRRK